MDHSSSSYPGSHPGNAAHVNGMLWDISSKLARAQIARQISNNSTLRRQQQSRIQKPVSTGNSPQNAVRRRHALQQQRLISHNSDIYPHVTRRRAITTTANPAAAPRPNTWHTRPFPSPEPYTYHRHTMCEPTQYAAQDHAGLQYGMTTPDSYMTHAFNSNAYTHVPISSDWVTEPSSTPSSQVGFDQNPAAIYHQHFLHTTPSVSMQPHHVHSNPSTPLPENLAPSPAVNSQRSDLNDADEDGGPELVGMGLYDLPEQSSLLFGAGVGERLASGAGRGLKLEDSWAPPDEDDGQSDDGDGEDEDQESEVQDDELAVEPDDSAVPSVYGLGNMLPRSDMSNKSFFFDDADTMVGAAALTDLTVANWHGIPQAWAR